MSVEYIQQEELNSISLTNDTGADLAQYDFTVIGAWAAIANNAVANGAVGYFDVREGVGFQADDLVTGEDTFAIEGQEVFWDPTGKEFSNTETAGYYLIGYLTEIKDANGVIVIEKLRHAILITT